MKTSLAFLALLAALAAAPATSRASTPASSPDPCPESLEHCAPGVDAIASTVLASGATLLAQTATLTPAPASTPAAASSSSPSTFAAIVAVLLKLLAGSSSYILPLVIAGIGWVSVKLAGYIDSKTKNAALAGVLDRLDYHVFAVVKELAQVEVPALLAAAGNGKLTTADRAALKQKALDTLKAHLGAEGLKELEDILGGADVESLLSTKVEAAVHDVKLASSPASYAAAGAAIAGVVLPKATAVAAAPAGG